MRVIHSNDHVSRASQILRGLGLSDTTIEPLESCSNSVWMTPEYVVHYHVIGPVGRLEHEARVAATLLPEALYPEVVGVGRENGHDWLVTKRVPGVALSAAWPHLSRHERRKAMHSIARALRALHCSSATEHVPPCLQGGVPVLSRYMLCEKLRALQVPQALVALLTGNYRPTIMAHGDFNFNQVMWHNGEVTALLDLEMAHAEAPDWDLTTFLQFCCDPVRMVPQHLEGISKPEDYQEAPFWLREAYPDMFAYPKMQDRLLLNTLVYRFTELAAQPHQCEVILDVCAEQAKALVALIL